MSKTLIIGTAGEGCCSVLNEIERQKEKKKKFWIATTLMPIMYASLFTKIESLVLHDC